MSGYGIWFAYNIDCVDVAVSRMLRIHDMERRFINLIWWVWRSWLARQIVALEAEGSSPSTHPLLSTRQRIMDEGP